MKIELLARHPIWGYKIPSGTEAEVARELLRNEDSYKKHGYADKLQRMKEEASRRKVSVEEFLKADTITVGPNHEFGA